MIRNLFKVGIRNILKDRTYSLINLFGLSAGFLVFMLVMLYVGYQKSYDRHFPNFSNVYRVDQSYLWGEDLDRFGSTGPAVAPDIAENVPSVEHTVRLYNPSEKLIRVEKEGMPVFFEAVDLIAADSSFFQVFEFDMLHGDPVKALAEPNSIVLTKSESVKLFGTERSIGRTMSFEEGGKQQSLIVTGVIDDVPTNSHFTFNSVVSMGTFPIVASRRWSWIWTGFVTYITLKDGTDVRSLEARLAALPRQKAGASLKRVYGQTFEEFIANGRSWELYLLPLKDIWLHSEDSPNRLGATNDIQNIYLFTTVGFMVLLLAIVNYMNLATARSSMRSKEIGIRKTMGALKGQIARQFLVEAFILSSVAFIVAVLMVEVLLPFFNDLMGEKIPFDVLLEPDTLLLFAGALLVTGVMAGSYPSFFMSRLNPLIAVKGSWKGKSGALLRNGLVIFQFVMSISLIVLTLLVYDQLSFIQNKEVGFDRDNLMVVPQVQRLGSSQETFKDLIKQSASVKEVGISSSVPPSIWNSDHFSNPEQPQVETPINYLASDNDYFQTLNIQLLYGSSFDEGFGDQVNKVIINEKAAERLGFDLNEGIIGKEIRYTGDQMTFEIMGVMKDFNYWSLHSPIEPLMMMHLSSNKWIRPMRFVSIRLENGANSSGLEATIDQIQTYWKELAPGMPFNYHFTDVAYNETFQFEKQLGETLRVFTVLAVLIACIGLFGLAAFIIERRTKELGIRKVLGSGAEQLVLLVGKDFMKLVIIAFVIAIPVGYLVGNQWLQNYEYRTTLDIGLFLCAGLMSILLSAITIVYHALRAARVNPVDTLRDE